MDSKNNIQIKVENEANKDFESEAYEEYTIMTYDCKQEDISDYTFAGVAAPDESTNLQAVHQDDQQAQTAIKGSRKVVNRKCKDTRLNCANKKNILNHFLTHGWTSKSYKDLFKKYPASKVEDYGRTLNKSIEEAQQFVYQECESLCFGNITDWLEVFKTMNVPENSYYEPAIIVNAIVNNEIHPDPEDLGGIDLREVYTFLCNGLMGLPQKQLDPISAKFLANEFETLINEANTDVADSQTLLMKQKLERILPQKRGQIPPSLDPLWLTEGTIVHKEIFSEKPEIQIVQNDIIVPKNESQSTIAACNDVYINENDDNCLVYEEVVSKPKIESNS